MSFESVGPAAVGLMDIPCHLVIAAFMARYVPVAFDLFHRVAFPVLFL